MLVDTIKARALEAMKAKDHDASNILRLALGEIQMAGVRSEREVTDEDAVTVLRKLIKSNEETLSMSEAPEQRATLQKEIALLQSFLPASMSVDAIAEALAPVLDAIRGAKSEGQATGVAMKHLKSTGANATGTDVAKAIKQLRGG
ncbi:GatB/YqeY domain-containing protein [Pendulispora rubella]|uniref:GatB/YqeY domain-containing protein n=1 Tax=Pendulispora rubella TaxID=2741070 RepID=A0ABZ2KZA1_9BACT